jgi:hypothetical protein
VVSKAKVSPYSIKKLILESIILPAAKATLSGLKGERAFAISSAFTNSLQSRSSATVIAKQWSFLLRLDLR